MTNQYKDLIFEKIAKIAFQNTTNIDGLELSYFDCENYSQLYKKLKEETPFTFLEPVNFSEIGMTKEELEEKGIFEDYSLMVNADVYCNDHGEVDKPLYLVVDNVVDYLQAILSSIKFDIEKTNIKEIPFETIIEKAFVYNTNMDRYSPVDFGCNSYTELWEELKNQGYLKLTEESLILEGFSPEEIEDPSFEEENQIYLVPNADIWFHKNRVVNQSPEAVVEETLTNIKYFLSELEDLQQELKNSNKNQNTSKKMKI